MDVYDFDSFLRNGIITDGIKRNCKDFPADMVFIDGPAGGENREPSYQLAITTKARYIVCHDSQREYERRWIKTYLNDYTLIAVSNSISVYENKPMAAKVLIAMPMPRDVKVDFEAMSFCAASIRKGWHWLNCPSVEPTLGRNALIVQFLYEEKFKDFTHIFFIDADTVPPPDTIERLLVHDKDMVAGVTPLWVNGVINWNIQIDRKVNILLEELSEELVKIKRVGGSTILIKREVLEKLEYPFYEVLLAKTIEEVQKTGPMLQGSDYYFCDKVIKAGFEIFADPSVKCKHIKQIDLLELITKRKE